MSEEKRTNNAELGAGAAVDDAQQIKAAVARLKTCIDEWKPVAGRAREKLWQVLAAIYAAHDLIHAHPEGREIMIESVTNMPGSSVNELKPQTKTTLELLVIYAVGLDRDTASSRSQYAACVGTALSDRGLERTEEAFLEWLERKGGIVKSISKASKIDPELEGLVVPFRYEQFKEHMAQMRRRETLKLKVDPERDVYDGFIVMFGTYDVESPDEVRLVETIGDPRVIKNAAQAVATQRVKNLPSEEKEARLRDQHLWDLNRIALKLANRLSGRVTWEDAERWTRAYHALEAADSHARKLFKAFAGVKFGDPTGIDGLSLIVEHADYHEYDPGRYIATARKGALVPYDLEALGTADGDKALDNYIRRHTDPYIYARPVELSEGAHPEEAVSFENAKPVTFDTARKRAKPKTKAKTKAKKKPEKVQYLSLRGVVSSGAPPPAVQTFNGEPCRFAGRASFRNASLLVLRLSRVPDSRSKDGLDRISGEGDEVVVAEVGIIERCGHRVVDSGELFGRKESVFGKGGDDPAEAVERGDRDELDRVLIDLFVGKVGRCGTRNLPVFGHQGAPPQTGRRGVI